MNRVLVALALSVLVAIPVRAGVEDWGRLGLGVMVETFAAT